MAAQVIEDKNSTDKETPGELSLFRERTGGGLVSFQSSTVMLASLPRAASHRNITPRFTPAPFAP